jgi:dTDP-4-dehydrorhamnose reductase
MANVLILGNGYVGSELFSRLAIPVSSTGGNTWIHSRSSFDYHDESKLRKFIGNNAITHVINCAGFTGRPNVDEGEDKKELCWELNVKLPLMISKVCKIFDINYIHISSGCIFSGYEKEYTEADRPNFGLFDESSFYSKTKHAFETLNDYGCTIRVRMPFCNQLHDRSYLTKILKYNNLIDYKNSKTYLPDLCSFIKHIIETDYRVNNIGVLNFVNPGALQTRDIVDLMHEADIKNNKWTFVDIDKLDIKAPRSNCTLSMFKFKSLFPKFEVLSETKAIQLALENIKHGE